MKKVILVCFSLLIVLVTSCGNNVDIKNYDKYKIIVCGTEVEDCGYYVDMPEHSGYAMLPLDSILESLGADVEWNNRFKARVIFNDKVYNLNTRKLSFIEEGVDGNCIVPAPGQNGIYHASYDGVFLLDQTTVNTLVRYMGIRLRFDVDTDKLLIYLDEYCMETGE